MSCILIEHYFGIEINILTVAGLKIVAGCGIEKKPMFDPY